MSLPLDFSKAAFDAARNRDALCLRLAAEIAQRVHLAAARELEAIALELRSLGHNIEVNSEYQPNFAAWHSFAEWKWSGEDLPPPQDDRKLRFYYDSQVSCFHD